MEARNVFHEGVGAGTLKCVAGYNHYGKRNRTINKEMIGEECPRCQSKETWEHIILCDGAYQLKENYINKLKDKIDKVKGKEQLSNEIQWMLSDINNYLYNQDDPGLTTQS